MNHGSVFSGIGGFDLAAEWMGWNNIFHCEINPFGKRILKYYWPNAISYEDITKTDFTIHRETIDVLTGGFPCQPFSNAGNKKGEDDNRYMFPEMLRAIHEIKPRWIVAENVYGITSKKFKHVFETICSSMEAEGYIVQPYIISASAVGAPHERERVWFVAYSSNARIEDMQSGRKDGIYETGFTTDFNKFDGDISGLCTGEISQLQASGICKDNAYTNGFGLEEIENKAKREFTINRDPWSVFPSQSPICSGNDGISNQLDGITFSKWRNESIKGYGNAVVPQVPYQIFKSIEQYEHNKT